MKKSLYALWALYLLSVGFVLWWILHPKAKLFTFVADDAPNGNWRGAYSAATTYKLGDTVVSGGAGSPIYLSAVDNNLNHALGNNAYWQQAPNVTWDGKTKYYYDKITVAFFAARAYTIANKTGALMRFGPGYWPTQLKLEQLPQSLYGVSMDGHGVTTSYIVDKSNDVLHSTLSSPGMNQPFVTISLTNFTVLANYQANGCGQFWGVNQPVFTNVNCVSPADSSSAYWVLGDPKDFGHHGFYGGTMTNLFVSGPTRPSTTALITANLVNGAVDPKSIVIQNPGAGYCGTDSHCSVWMKFYVPGGCAVEPAGKAAVSSGRISSVTMTNNGSKCIGSELNIQTANVSPVPIGVDARGASDTRFYNLTTQGPQWGIDLSVGGNNSLNGSHFTYGPYGARLGGNNVADANEIDQIQSIGFYVLGASGIRIGGTHSFSPAVGPGAVTYMFDSTASNVTFTGDAQLQSHANTNRKWGALAMGGVIDTNIGLLPPGTNVLGSPATKSGGLGATVIQGGAYIGNLNVSRFAAANCSATGGLNGASAAGTFGYTPKGGIRGCIGQNNNFAWTPITAANEVVPFSPTPTFSAETTSSSIIMTGSITTFTLPPGSDGQGKTLTFCQDRVGGWKLNGPPNVRGLMNIGGTANRCNSQHFVYYVAQKLWLADGPGKTNL